MLEGEKIPTLRFGVDFMDLIRAAQGTRHPVPMHTDRAYAVAAGNRDSCFSTLWRAGILGRYVTDWSGLLGELSELSISMISNICPRDHVTINGLVTYASSRHVEIDMVMSTEWGIATKGKASVCLPLAI